MKQTIPTIIALTALMVAIFGILRPQQTRPLEAENQVGSTTLPPALQENVEPPGPIIEQVDPVYNRTDLESIAKLEARLTEVEIRLSEIQAGWKALGRRGMVPLSDAYRAELEYALGDTALPPSDRLAAFDTLSHHLILTDQAVVAMLDIAQNTSDPRSAAEAQKHLEGLCSAAGRGSRPSCP